MAFTLVVSRWKPKLCVGNLSVVKIYIIRIFNYLFNVDNLLAISLTLLFYIYIYIIMFETTFFLLTANRPELYEVFNTRSSSFSWLVLQNLISFWISVLSVCWFQCFVTFYHLIIIKSLFTLIKRTIRLVLTSDQHKRLLINYKYY